MDNIILVNQFENYLLTTNKDIKNKKQVMRKLKIQEGD